METKIKCRFTRILFRVCTICVKHIDISHGPLVSLYFFFHKGNLKLDHLFNLFNSFSKISMVSPLLQGTMDNFLHCTLHSNIIWLPSVLLWTAILYWNVMKNEEVVHCTLKKKGRPSKIWKKSKRKTSGRIIKK